MTRTDAVKAELAAMVEARRSEIDGAADIRRVELFFYFDDRTGELFESEIKTVSRRRIARRVSTGRGKIPAVALR